MARETATGINYQKFAEHELIQNTRNTLLVVDVKGDILWVNYRVYHMFGYQPEELIGNSVECLIPHPYQEEHIQHRHDFFNHPSQHLMGEGRDLAAKRKDGSLFPVEIALNYTDTDHGPLAFATITDISRRTIDTQDRLEFLVEQTRYAFLSAVFTSLTRTLQERVSGIHTGLYLVRNTLDLAAREQHLKSVERQSQNLLDFVDSIRMLSQLIHTPEETLQPVNVNTLITQVKDAFKEKAKEKNVTFELEMDKNVPRVLGDNKYLSLAVVGLVENAIKHTNQEGKIVIRSIRDGDDVAIEIHDPNLDIDEADLSQFFRFFHQFNTNPLATPMEDNLELTLSNRIINLHEGTIIVVSAPGKGSTFRINLEGMQNLEEVEKSLKK